MLAPWHVLLAPLPADARVERTADVIAGWESLSVNLSDPPRGLRHVLVTVDGDGTLLSATDWVLVSRAEVRDGVELTIHDHHNIGGRFEPDGSFRGTVWRTQSEQRAEDDDAGMVSSSPSTPTGADVDALRRLAADVIRRAPERT